MQMYKNILITGASSGVGEALALEYANKGITLHLLARNADRLAQVANQCIELGADCYCHVVDVRNSEAMEITLESIIANYSIPDLIIANAGVSAKSNGNSLNETKDLFATNFIGAINTIEPLIPHLIKTKRGHIAIMSSLAGVVGLPSCISYSSSKAAIRVYGDSIRNYLKKYNIKVSTIIPGFIKTPLTELNDFKMPLKISAKKAAHIIKNGINKNKPLIAFPKLLYYPIVFLSFLPSKIADFIISSLIKEDK
jgi:short-subunit dehydrogenase